MKKIVFNLFIILIILFSNNQHANEILLYADDISYDSNKNIIAKGNAKIIKNEEIITADLIIYNSNNKTIIMPSEFVYRDSINNYYLGSSGKFDEGFKNGEIEDVKILLNDGTRIVGKKAIRKGKIDIINKGVYTQCKSRINIKDFVCPIWQLEGEKILHDYENLFLYQKHSKMRLFNVPVFYLPYLVTPSPLRKKRKSGFLSPTLNFNFIDAKTSQNASFPYYFNIDIDKELTLTPIMRYGGGIDSSQRFLFDYNQLISGGNLDIDVSIDTKIENQNNEKWFSNGSIITDYSQNLNENYNISVKSALQTSRTYIRETDKDNSYINDASLSTTLDLNRYGILKYDDKLRLNVSTYQVVKKNQDNAVTPLVLPYITYYYHNYYGKTFYENKLQFYNITRDENSSTHAKQQRKLALNTNLDRVYYNFNSKINFKGELHNQYFQTKDKLIDNNKITSENYRFFPMAGIFVETPIRHIENNLLITPKFSLIVNSSQKNKNEISNEDSTNQTINITSQSQLNRFNGTDKLDNSQRFLYGFNITRKNLSSSFSQNYEFDTKSDYNQEIGNSRNLSDALFETSLNFANTNIEHDLRYSPHLEKIRSQSLSLNNKNILGTFDINYFDEKKESNNILTTGKETFEFNYVSNKINKFSTISFKSLYDLVDDKGDEYILGYEYFDECFGINIDFKRSFYEDDTLKPQDSLTLMFSFKNLGAYKSSNLAVSEQEKQDINWENINISNDKFQ